MRKVFLMIQTRHVLYDGGCGLCGRTSRVLRRVDWLRKIVYHDIAHDWPAIQAQFPQLNFDNCMRDMHVITDDGRTERGFDAYRLLAWALPVFWPILPLLYLPPVRWLGWKIYRRVADTRSCAVEP
jgi:predicted DCC family thiol-disulfide oxidoreductase YuxK